MSRSAIKLKLCARACVREKKNAASQLAMKKMMESTLRALKMKARTVVGSRQSGGAPVMCCDPGTFTKGGRKEGVGQVGQKTYPGTWDGKLNQI